MKVTELNKLATTMVGDSGKPNVFFVSLMSNVVMVTTDFQAAYSHWKKLARCQREKESTLEDRRYGVICSVEPDENPMVKRLRVYDDSMMFIRYYRN